MKRIYRLAPLGGLLAVGAAQAHGPHAELPADGVMHFLAHQWPLLPFAAILIGGYLLLRQKRG